MWFAFRRWSHPTRSASYDCRSRKGCLMAPWLLTTIFLPLAGGAAIWALPWLGRTGARWVALIVSLATLATAAWVVGNYQDEPAGYAASEWAWLGTSGIDVKF